VFLYYEDGRAFTELDCLHTLSFLTQPITQVFDF